MPVPAVAVVGTVVKNDVFSFWLYIFIMEEACTLENVSDRRDEGLHPSEKLVGSLLQLDEAVPFFP